MNAQTFFLAHLDVIHQAVATVCRRHALTGAEAEDFASAVHLKLIEHNYAVVRKYEGRSSFHAYVIVVATRLLLDERNHEYGKWRASTAAKRLGGTAMLLERLLHRDHRTLDEALLTIQRHDHAIARRDVEALAARLPSRKRRPRAVALERAELHAAIAPDTVTAAAEEQELLRLARRTAAILRAAIRRLPEQHRLILRMRFAAGMTVAEIARALQVPQKPVYRLLTAQLKRFRRILERAGIGARDVDDMVGIAATPLDGDLHDTAGEE